MLIVLCVCSRHWAFSQTRPAKTTFEPSQGMVSAILNENAGYQNMVYRNTVYQNTAHQNTAVDYSSCPTWQDSELSMCGDDYCDGSGAERTFSGRFRGVFREGWHDVRSDYRNYYRWHTARDFLLCLGGAAVMANTTIDEKFQHWVQEDVKSSGSDDFASFWKQFGEGQIFIPAWAGLAVAGSMLEEWPVMGTAGDFGSRATRSYLVGAPPVIFMQYCLGGSRPGEGHGSAWKPFNDNNGVSGHAFIGAVPFITAAQMSENCYVKGCFYFLSTLPAWSRINDDSHYLSQAWMGWWMAYLSCRSVNETEQGKRKCMAIAPILAPDTVGMMFEYRR